MFPINEVLQGDCTRVLKQLPDGFVDLVVTDPPYGVRYQDSKGRTIANDDDPSRVLGAFTDLYRVLKLDSVCISFYGWGQVDAFFRAWRRAGFRPVGHIVWVKEYASRTRYVHYRHEQPYVLAKGSPTMPEQPIDDIQPWVYSGNQDHPTQKAVRILTPLIEAFSQPGQLTLILSLAPAAPWSRRPSVADAISESSWSRTTAVWPASGLRMGNVSFPNQTAWRRGLARTGWICLPPTLMVSSTGFARGTTKVSRE